MDINAGMDNISQANFQSEASSIAGAVHVIIKDKSQVASIRPVTPCNTLAGHIENIVGEIGKRQVLRAGSKADVFFTVIVHYYICVACNAGLMRIIVTVSSFSNEGSH